MLAPAELFSAEEAEKLSRLFQALADPTRLQILELLLRRGETVCVSEIVALFTLEQPTISHHLRTLRKAKLIDVRKSGHWGYYFIPENQKWVVQTYLCVRVYGEK